MKEILHFSAVLFLAGTIGEILQTTLHSSLKIVHRKNVKLGFSTVLHFQLKNVTLPVSPFQT